MSVTIVVTKIFLNFFFFAIDTILYIRYIIYISNGELAPARIEDKTMITTAKYIGMYTKVQTGQITVQQWQTFCMQYLCQIMAQPQNKAMLVRLKFMA